MEDIRVGRVIQQQGLAGRSINHADIFGVNFARNLMAMLPIQPMAKYFMLWVDFIENRINVGLVAGSEHNDLE